MPAMKRKASEKERAQVFSPRRTREAPAPRKILDPSAGAHSKTYGEAMVVGAAGGAGARRGGGQTSGMAVKT